MKRILFFIISTMYLTSCTDEQAIVLNHAQTILFEVEEVSKTRRDQITNDQGTNPLLSMAVFCTYTEEAKWNTAAIFNWMYNAKVARNDINKPWSILSGEIANSQWAGNGYHTFFAFAPYGVEGATYSPAVNAPGLPQLTYTVPVDHTKQIDLLYSAKTLVDGRHMYVGGHPVNFGFQHALSKISFSAALKAGISGIKIKQIEVAGVNSSGTFAYDLGAGTPNATNARWESPSTLASFPLTVSNGGILDVTLQNDPTYTTLTPAGKGAFLLPQTLPDNAKLKITLVDVASGYEFVREYTLKTFTPQWEPTKSYNYKLLYDGVEIICFGIDVTPWDQESENIDLNLKLTPVLNIVSADNFTYSYLGKTSSFTVESYGTTEQGTKVNIPWKVEYETAPGSNVWTATRPAWLPTLTESGIGSTIPAACNIQIAAQTSIPKTGAELLDQTVKGSAANPYDLSTNGGATSRNTANCYVVNGPGTYKIPLVFGNAIKNGVANTTAYNGGNFVSASNNPVLDPWIKNNTGSVPANATLVWQEQTGLITGVQKNTDDIIFTVDAATIKPGNAIIAVRNSSNVILWSWHIWITPWKPGYETEMKSGVKVMNVNVGWVDNDSIAYYVSRSVKARFSQEGYPATAKIVDINQKTYCLPNKSGYSPYYQWGRKDPLWATTGISNTPLTVPAGLPYTPAGFDYGLQQATTKEHAIKNPHLFFWAGNGPVKWCNNINPNDWRSGNVKAIYDPTPAGYRMPVKTEYEGLTKVETYNNGTAVTASGTPLPFTAPYSFFRGLGYRPVSSTGYIAFGNGLYWTATYESTDHAWALSFSSTAFLLNNPGTGDGFPVRAVME